MYADPEKVKAVVYSPEAVKQCRRLIKTDPAELDIDRFFEELRSIYERRDIEGAFLFSQVWFQFHRKNLTEVVKFAHANRSREDLNPMLSWLKETLLSKDQQRDQSAAWEEAARQWVAGYSILDDIVEELDG